MNIDVKKLEKKVINDSSINSKGDDQFEKGHSLLSDAIRKFKANKMALTGLFAISFLFMVSMFSSFTAPYSFDEGSIQKQNFPPTWYKALMTEEYKKASLVWAENELKNDTYNADDFLDEEDQDMEMDEDAEIAAMELEDEVSEGDQPNPIGLFDESIDHLGAKMTISYLSMTNSEHLLGTDEIGQDIFSRIIFGMKLSLLLSISVTIVSVFIGVIYGSISGYYGGMVDALMMRFVDFLFGVPFIFLIILLMVFFGRHVYLIFVGLGLIYWIVLARIVRGQILSIKEKEFVMAAKSNGVSEFKIIFKHLVPNVLGPCIVFSTLLIPQIMLLEAFLSFIGLGVTPPDVSLGILISKGASVLSNFSWPIIFPSLIFSLMVFSMNFIGDGIRDALDPKQQ